MRRQKSYELRVARYELGTRVRTMRDSQLATRNSKLAAFALLALVIAVAGACAVRLGGGGPETFRTLAYSAPEGETAEDAAARIATAAADIVLLAGPGDSAWFADVANRTQLELSGPGRPGDGAQAFLTRRLEILGDTSITLDVSGGGRIHMHDALYEISDRRYVDLMLVQLDTEELREAMRALLSYIATDVGATAAVMFALDAATPEAADSAATLLRAAYTNAWECAESVGEASAEPEIELRLFYGPAVRMDCEQAMVLNAPGNPVVADLVVR